MEEKFLEKKKRGLVHCFEGNGMVFVTPDEFTRFAYAQKKRLTERNKQDLLIAPEAVQFKIVDIISRKYRPPKLGDSIADTIFPMTRPQTKNFARKVHKQQVIEHAKKVIFDLVSKTGIAMTPTKVFENEEFRKVFGELKDWSKLDSKAVFEYTKRQICRWIAVVIPQSKNGRPKKN